MNAVLRVISEAKQDSVDHIVREWEKQVHDLVYDAQDCTDMYTLRVIRPIPLLTADDVGGSRLTFWPRYLLARVKHIVRYRYEKLMLQRTLAADINALLARTTIVSERRARYGIDRVALPSVSRYARFAPVLAASTYASANALRHADDPPQFVGIREQVNALADKMRRSFHYDDSKSLEVFYIVGFGGSGKTTLAMELCRELDMDFPCQAQVSVSQTFDGEKDIKGLLLRMHQQLLKEKADAKSKQSNKEGMNVEELTSKIMELLQNNRYLILIDDVRSVPAWEAIRSRLPENKCGSKIIVTTRLRAVVKTDNVFFVHHMEPQKPEASKKLLVKKVFGSMDGCLDGLQLVMDRILDKCDGLPLTIVIIAGFLAGYMSDEDKWRRASKMIDSHMEGCPTHERMRQLITFCYEWLPRHLKACMMYLSIFPEGYVIVKDRLLYRWIVEGLVTEIPGLTMLEVAEEYLNELISRNMIQLEKTVCTEEPYCREVDVEGCRVHDMILEVMVSKCKESNFVTLVGWKYRGMPHGYDRVRHLSLHGNGHDEQHNGVAGIDVMKLRYVRSLTTFQHYGIDFNKLLNRLGEFKLLRVLDLEDCKVLQDKHMRDVCGLYLLRFLSLRGTNVSKMPRKVSNLEHLETLDIKSTSIGKRLPRTVIKLSKLERLRSNEWLLPRGLGNMKALHEVENGVIKGDDVKVAQEISKLPQLVSLSIRIENQYEHEEFLHELASSLRKTRALQSLYLDYPGGRLSFLQEVSPPPPLQCLSLYGSNSELPGWISSLKHLTKFEVGRAELDGDQLFDVLCRLPNLQSVQLRENSYRDPELVARTFHYFPVLRILEVSSSPTLTKLTFEEETMRELETLVLGFGNGEMSLVGVENFKSLKQVKLRGKEGNLAMERAVQQLRTRSTESNQIKVVVDFN